MPLKPVLPGLAIVFSGLLATTSPSVYAAHSSTIKKGEQLYNQNCSACHQPGGVGKEGIAPSITNPELLSIASSKFFESTINDGRPGTGMPPWSHLGKKDIRAIIAYLRSFSKLPNRSAAVNAEPKSHGNVRTGEQWFNNVCAGCHGINGVGYSAGGSGTAIGKAGFQDKVTDGFIRETIKHGRPGTDMHGFSSAAGLAHLSPKMINNIVAYMRTLPKKN